MFTPKAFIRNWFIFNPVERYTFWYHARRKYPELFATLPFNNQLKKPPWWHHFPPHTQRRATSAHLYEGATNASSYLSHSILGFQDFDYDMHLTKVSKVTENEGKDNWKADIDRKNGTPQEIWYVHPAPTPLPGQNRHWPCNRSYQNLFMIFSTDEFRTAQYLQFTITPSNLPSDGGGISNLRNTCNEKLCVDHAFHRR